MSRSETSVYGSWLLSDKSHLGTGRESQRRGVKAALWREAGAHVNLEDVERDNLLGEQVDRPDGAR
eukprot:1326649-Pleurochrysis_carterae.AAC.1